MQTTDNKDFHHMGRRNMRKDYSLPGVYHVTISTNHDLLPPRAERVTSLSTRCPILMYGQEPANR